MEFPGLNVNRAVLDVQAPAATASSSSEKTDSLFIRFIKEVEPEEPGKGFEPGRFFKEHISGYEPMYFIAGPKSPNGKFQISFAYQLLNRDGQLAEKFPRSKVFTSLTRRLRYGIGTRRPRRFTTRATGRNFFIFGKT